MRHLRSHPGSPRGLTLIEVVVALAVAAMLALAAAPYLGDFTTNARLREAGNALYAEALFAQGEAIKRNRQVRLSIANGVVTVDDMTVPTAPLTLRQSVLPTGILAPNTSFSFTSTGWPLNLASASVDITHATATCSSDTRCPGLRVEAGGAVRLCSNYLSNC